MDLGRPIVSSSIGAEGLNVKDRENILIADSAKEFPRKTYFAPIEIKKG